METYARIVEGTVRAVRTGEGEPPEGWVNITGKQAAIGDQTDDGGETFREREPSANRALRALAMAIKSLDKGEPIPQRVIDELRKIKDM